MWKNIFSNQAFVFSGGDTSAKNMWLCENVLNMLTSNQAWVEKSTNVLQMTVYTYLRLLQVRLGAFGESRANCSLVKSQT